MDYGFEFYIVGFLALRGNLTVYFLMYHSENSIKNWNTKEKIPKPTDLKIINIDLYVTKMY